jgi:hypothetical protein
MLDDRFRLPVQPAGANRPGIGRSRAVHSFERSIHEVHLGARNGVPGVRPNFGHLSRHGGRTLAWTEDPGGTQCNSVEDCDAQEICTSDECVEGFCQHSPIAGCCEDFTDCNDTDPCTLDVCVNNFCTTQPFCCEIDADCDDGNLCTEESCLDGTCNFVPVEGCCVLPSDCDDGDVADDSLLELHDSSWGFGTNVAGFYLNRCIARQPS